LEESVCHTAVSETTYSPRDGERKLGSRSENAIRPQFEGIRHFRRVHPCLRLPCRLSLWQTWPIGVAVSREDDEGFLSLKLAHQACCVMGLFSEVNRVVDKTTARSPVAQACRGHIGPSHGGFTANIGGPAAPLSPKRRNRATVRCNPSLH
jgi:hypothetical protein